MFKWQKNTRTVKALFLAIIVLRPFVRSATTTTRANSAFSLSYCLLLRAALAQRLVEELDSANPTLCRNVEECLKSSLERHTATINMPLPALATAFAWQQLSDCHRQRPNLLVTGTPGTGKSTLCEELADTCCLTHVQVGELVRTHKLYSEWDDVRDCSVFDEELVLQKLEENGIEEGGTVVDFHSCGFLPEEWFDLVVVLRADTSVLGERLEKRRYSESKIRENIECEIFQVVRDEAAETFREELVTELQNSSMDDFDGNAKALHEWVSEWMRRKTNRVSPDEH